ncbi:MAG: DUF6686 family protein [Flavobacteriaceae bacterium]
MCSHTTILKQTKNGMLSFCNQNKLFQLVFNNLCFEFYEWELDAFKAHIAELDADYWEETLSHSIHQRKIPISVNNKFFVILVNKREVDELRKLMNVSSRRVQLIHVKDINYYYIEN